MITVVTYLFLKDQHENKIEVEIWLKNKEVSKIKNFFTETR